MPGLVFPQVFNPNTSSIAASAILDAISQRSPHMDNECIQDLPQNVQTAGDFCDNEYSNFMAYCMRMIIKPKLWIISIIWMRMTIKAG